MSVSLRDIPLGDMIIFGARHLDNVDATLDLQWQKADSNGTMVCLTGVRMIFDEAEPDSDVYDHRENGNEDYFKSAIHQWMNSDKRTWFTPQHEFDHDPRNDLPGFLTSFSPEEMRFIVPTTVKAAVDDGRGYYVTERDVLIWLPSATEFGRESRFELTRRGFHAGRGGEGSVFEFYRNHAFCDRTITRTPVDRGKIFQINAVTNIVTCQSLRNAHVAMRLSLDTRFELDPESGMYYFDDSEIGNDLYEILRV